MITSPYDDNCRGIVPKDDAVRACLSPAANPVSEMFMESPIRRAPPQIACEVYDYSTASDNDLVLKANSGVQKAFTELCRRHAPRVKKRLQSMLRNQQDAEDILQETLFRAYVHLEGFGGRSKFSTWLTTIAVNTALMLLRKRRVRREVLNGDVVEGDGGRFESIEFADPSPNPEQQLAKRQASLLLKREVQRLRPPFRALVDKYYNDGSTLGETAEALGITVSTAKARLYKARLKLRSSFARYGVVSSDS